jgi:hypothetical protein
MKTLLVAGVLGIVAIGVVLALLRLSSSETSETTTQGARQDAFKILVQEDGFYRFSLEELPDEESSTADFLEPEMRLSQGGRPAHFLLDGDDFIFYGRRSDSRYSATRPYILELGTSGPSMSEALLPAVDEIVSSVPQTLHFEHNLIYDSRARQPGGSFGFVSGALPTTARLIWTTTLNCWSMTNQWTPYAGTARVI